MTRTKVRLAIGAGLVMLAVSSVGQAASGSQDTSSDHESIARIEILLHDPESDPRGDRHIAVFALGHSTGFYEYRMEGDGTDRERLLEYRLVDKACRTSKKACIALTHELIVDIWYR